MLAQLRTGHCGLNQYLWRFKKVDNAECGNCGYQKETVERFLIECPAYYEERWDLEKTLGPEAMKVAFLLGNRKAVKATMEFVKKTGRLKVYKRTHAYHISMYITFTFHFILEQKLD